VVIVVGPPEDAAPASADIDARLDALLVRLSLRDAVSALAAETGVSRRALYDRALARQRTET
jgi:16S rRNA (cytidine1402-2'-O)-methyltransferase